MKVILELQDHPSNVRKVTVRHDIVIGRGADCNLRLSAPQISRRHCFLRVGRDGVSVTDLDSSNGTFVDGKRITGGVRFDLVDGALLALGPVQFLIHIRDQVGVDVSAEGAQSQVHGQRAGSTSQEQSNAAGASVLGRNISAVSRPLDFSVEQGGEAASSNEPTADLKGHSGNQRRGFSEGPIDSVAEIVDLGRRIAESDAAELVRGEVSPGNAEEDSVIEDHSFFGDRPLPGVVDEDMDSEIFSAEVVDNAEGPVDAQTMSDPSSEVDSANAGQGLAFQRTFMGEVDEYHDIVEVVDDAGQIYSADVEEIIEVVEDDLVEVLEDDPQIVLEEADVLEDVVEICDAEVIEEVAEVEIVEEVAEEEDGSAWFDQSADDDDEGDPDLRKFLKGF